MALQSPLTIVAPKSPNEEGTDSLFVTWNGPDGSESPMNWSYGKKIWVMFQVGLLTFSVYIGSSIFVGIYHFKEQYLGLAFLGILGGMLVTIPPFLYYLYNVQEKMFDENGKIKPEKRMIIAIFGSFFLPVCLLWFGWTSRPSIHWIVPILGSALSPSAGVLLYNSVLGYLADAYPSYTVSVFAGKTLFRAGFGAGFPLFGTAMYENIGTGWASTLLGLLSLRFIPIPILLHYYGERIRIASKRAQHH